MTDATSTAPPLWKTYYSLCKPKVVYLIVFTALVGMFLSVEGMVPWVPLILGSLGIGLSAASGAAINHIVDRRIDAKMSRTAKRPLPTGQINEKQALIFALSLAVISMVILILWINLLTAALTFLSLIGYAVIYTGYLKRATPQNIVIGGAAGASPPILGWTAVTGEVHIHALLLFLIIFIWTPPHFWALAIKRREEYAKIDMPMMPVTHGSAFTKIQILLYTILLFLVTLLPWVTHMSGLLYLAAAVILGVIFLYYAIRLLRSDDDTFAMPTFAYSISYLGLLFLFLLIDHYI
ncbi:MAG TPA: protoheme IX farnesyltransferase [Myxococcales bacterium]|nr:protoheme IX farnesyltransferase [Myxococcales bacterium]